MNEPNELDLPFDYHCADNDRLVIFLPSVRSKNVFPYYPRISLKTIVPLADTLYIADPLQDLDEYSTPGGSWFINQLGDSELFRIAQVLTKWLATTRYRQVVFYGSSMGGYAALVLAALIPGSVAIAECPQIYLQKHPGSAHVISRFCTSGTGRLPEVESIAYYSNGSSYHIVANVFDPHVSVHILPFMETLRKSADLLDSVFLFSFYSSPNYERGHVALHTEECLCLVRNAFDRGFILSRDFKVKLDE